MRALINCVVLLCLVLPKAHGQITVFQDEKGQVYTRGAFIPKTDVQLPYRGSPFLTFPVWQTGNVRLDTHGQELACELAYDLVANELLCRFPGDSTVKTITPERFTINGKAFVRQQDKVAGVDYRLYTTMLHDGQTKLLVGLHKRIERYSEGNNGYAKEMDVGGAYVLVTTYYIRKGNARPKPIILTKSAVLTALYEQADKLARKLPGKRLTAIDVANALTYYDSLMTENWVSKPAFVNDNDSSQRRPAGYAISKAPLSNDPVFNESLHQQIAYPGQAWVQGIYGRVYAGFDINQQGRIENIIILSPENMEMGFVESARAGLKKLPDLNPAFSGSYALPITFTYTNTRENVGAHVPTNRLPAERLLGRTLLEEFRVPVVVSKPIIASREIWGYYR